MALGKDLIREVPCDAVILVVKSYSGTGIVKTILCALSVSIICAFISGSAISVLYKIM
jgi:hypothetical protein